MRVCMKNKVKIIDAELSQNRNLEGGGVALKNLPLKLGYTIEYC